MTKVRQSDDKKVLKSQRNFGYALNMKFTREYIKQQIDLAVAADPERRALSVVVKTNEPRHEFVLSYDVQTKTVNGVIEKIGRNRKIPRTLSEILRN